MDALLNGGEFGQKSSPLRWIIASACPQCQDILALELEIRPHDKGVAAAFEHGLKIAQQVAPTHLAVVDLQPGITACPVATNYPVIVLTPQRFRNLSAPHSPDP